MDVPLEASVHKENVHIGGGKASAKIKLHMLKTAKATGKDRKALADLKKSHKPLTCASKVVGLKQKSQMKGNQVKKKIIELKEKREVVDLTKKPVVSATLKEAHLNSKLALLGNLRKANISLANMLTDEEIKMCYEWAKDGIEEMGGYSWSEKDEKNLINTSINEIMAASATAVPISELESPLLSEEEGYCTDGSDLQSYLSYPGQFSSVYRPKVLEDPVGVAGIVLDEYPLPELMLNED